MKKLGELTFHGEKLQILQSEYDNNGRIAIIIRCEDGSPYAKLSTNIVDADLPDENCFFVKNWSENQEIAKAVEDAGIFQHAGVPDQPTGRVKAPVWRLK